MGWAGLGALGFKYHFRPGLVFRTSSRIVPLLVLEH